MTNKSSAQEAEIVGENPKVEYEKSNSKRKSGQKSANSGQKYRAGGRKSASTDMIKIMKVNRYVVIFAAILIICIFALLLKFVVGLLGGLLQFIIIVAAIGLIAALIYNFIREKQR